MSEHRIRDNTGSGYGLKVDAFNRAHTDATTAPEIKFEAAQGRSFLTATPTLALAAGVETSVLWICVNSDLLFGHMNRVIASYNGGDTNHNRSMIVRLYAGTPTPSANSTLYEPVNMLAGNPTTAPATAYVWDGVGAGMTVASNGVLVGSLYVAHGTTDVDFSGAFILGKNSVVSFTLEAEESGGGSILSTGYFKELED